MSGISVNVRIWSILCVEVLNMKNMEYRKHKMVLWQENNSWLFLRNLDTLFVVKQVGAIALIQTVFCDDAIVCP